MEGLQELTLALLRRTIKSMAIFSRFLYPLAIFHSEKAVAVPPHAAHILYLPVPPYEILLVLNSSRLLVPLIFSLPSTTG